MTPLPESRPAAEAALSEDPATAWYDDTCCDVFGTAVAVLHDRGLAAGVVHAVYVDAWQSEDPAARSAPALRFAARRLAADRVRRMSSADRLAVGEASLNVAWRHCSGESQTGLPPRRACLVLALALRHGCDGGLISELLGASRHEVDRLLVEELRALGRCGARAPRSAAT